MVKIGEGYNYLSINYYFGISRDWLGLLPALMVVLNSNTGTVSIVTLELGFPKCLWQVMKNNRRYRNELTCNACMLNLWKQHELPLVQGKPPEKKIYQWQSTHKCTSKQSSIVISTHSTDYQDISFTLQY